MSRNEIESLWLERQVERLKVERLKDQLRLVERQRNWLGLYLSIMAFAVLVLSPNPLMSLGGLALLALSAYVAVLWK